MGLFFRRKKAKKLAEKPPTWFMWLLGVFVAYAVLTNVLSDKPVQNAPLQAKNAIKEEPFDIKAMLMRGESKTESRAMAIRTLTEGQGKEAACWEKVSIRYSLVKEDATEVENNQKATEPFTFTIGRKEVVPGLERGVMGMKQGEVRLIALRSDMAFGAPDFSHAALTDQDRVGYKVTLESIELPAAFPTTGFGLKTYDDVAGKGAITQCTDRVYVRVKGWRLNGDALWGPAKTKLVRVGAGEVPYAIERAAMGMMPGGKRTVIAPAGYMRLVYDDPIPDDEAAQQDAVEKALAAPPVSSSQSVAVLQHLVDADRDFFRLPDPQNEPVLLEVEVFDENPAP